MSTEKNSESATNLLVLLGYLIAAMSWLFGSTFVLMIGVVIVQLATGTGEPVDPENLVSQLDAGTFALLTFVGNGGMAALAVVVAAVLTAPDAPPATSRLRHNLALANPRIGWWIVAVLAAPTVGLLPGWVATNLVELAPQLSGGTLDQISAVIGPDVPLTFGVIAMLFTVAIGAPVIEEVIFRGLLWSLVERLGGPIVALISTTALFLLFHASIVQIIAIIPTALLFALLRWGSGSLWPPMLAHVINNCLASFIMRFSDVNDTEIALPLWAALLGTVWTFGLIGAAFLWSRPTRLVSTGP